MSVDPPMRESVQRRLAGIYALWGVVAIAAYLAIKPSLTSDVLYLVVLASACFAVLFGTVRNRPPSPWPWTFLALGLTLTLCGETVWVYDDMLAERPFPSIADAFFLAAYPAYALAVRGLLRERASKRDVFALLDALIVLVAVSLLSWTFLMRPVLDDSLLSTIDKVVTVAYPILGLMLVAVLAPLLFAVGMRSKALWGVAVAMCLQILTNAACAWQSVNGSFGEGTIVDIGWMLTWLIIGTAALHPSMASAVLPDRTNLRVSVSPLLVLSLAAMIPSAVIVVQQFSVASDIDGTVLVVAAVAAQVVFCLALARMWGLVMTVRNLTQRQGEARFAAMVENSTDVIAVVDKHMRITYTSPSARIMLGQRPEQLLGRSFLEVVLPLDVPTVQAQLLRAAGIPHAHSVEMDACITRSDGVIRNVEIVASNLLNDAVVGGLVVTVRDVTEQKSLQLELSHQAFHDGLTGLANRALFVDRVEQALRRRRRHPHVCPAVLFVDLDDFKAVNDGLGHTAGDDLLRVVAQRITACIRQGDTVARLGGDEFAILLEEDGDELQAVLMAERILDAMHRPMQLDSIELTVKASIGVAVAERDAKTAWLMRDADIAMYEAKRLGKAGYKLFDPAMRASAADRLAMKADLGVALAEGQMITLYQPIIDLETGAVHGAESLLRWNHPTRGFVPPLEFVSLAEQSGMIVPIGRWVLEQACREAARWQSFQPGISVSVNASGVQFGDPAFIEDVRGALAQANLPAHCLTIEITETVIMDDTERTAIVLEHLRRLGVKVAIDDFGTGYCSLAYLQRYPVDSIKIDRTFVVELARDRRGSSLAETILRMADALGLRSIAEGIEDLDQVVVLRALGCCYGQGYLFARPLDAAAFREFVVSESGREERLADWRSAAVSVTIEGSEARDAASCDVAALSCSVGTLPQPGLPAPSVQAPSLGWPPPAPHSRIPIVPRHDGEGLTAPVASSA
jgi:diguanylate cyclase (GGDEF)-like protein/PAS domain S-box-containing protein